MWWSVHKIKLSCCIWLARKAPHGGPNRRQPHKKAKSRAASKLKLHQKSLPKANDKIKPDATVWNLTLSASDDDDVKVRKEEREKLESRTFSAGKDTFVLSVLNQGNACTSIFLAVCQYYKWFEFTNIKIISYRAKCFWLNFILQKLDRAIRFFQQMEMRAGSEKRRTEQKYDPWPRNIH